MAIKAHQSLQGTMVVALVWVPLDDVDGEYVVGHMELDVRTLGFLTMAELHADPDCDRYIEDAARRAGVTTAQPKRVSW